MGKLILIPPKKYRVKEIYAWRGNTASLRLDHPDLGKIVGMFEGPAGDSPFDYVYFLEEVEVKDLILCKDCKHRPIKVDKYVIGPRYDDGFRDETCPFLCDDVYYSRMPLDDFYCAYGEKK